MDKLVMLAVVVLITVSIWAVMPSESQRPKTQTSDTAKILKSRTGSSTAGNPRKTSAVDANKPAGRPEGVINQGLSKSNQPSAEAKLNTQQDPKSIVVNPQLINKAVRSFKQRPQTAGEEPSTDEVRGTFDNPYGQVHWDGEMEYGELESALMKHYAKRTPQGGLPKTVQAHEVLNDTVLKAMNVSRNLPVTMIGDFEPADPRSVTDTLKRARKGEHETGFTFDDGTTGGRRVYVKVVGD